MPTTGVWFSCIGSWSNWVAGTSTTGWCLRALSGQYNTPRVRALKAVINGPCSHDSRVFTQTPLEEVLVLMTRSKTAQGAESGGTVKTWAGRPHWERWICSCGPTKLFRGGPGLQRRAGQSGTAAEGESAHSPSQAPVCPPRMSQCLIIIYKMGNCISPVCSEGENCQIPPLNPLSQRPRDNTSSSYRPHLKETELRASRVGRKSSLTNTTGST